MNDDTIEQRLLADGERWRRSHDRPPDLPPRSDRRRWPPAAAAVAVLAVVAAGVTVAAFRSRPDPAPGHPTVNSIPCADPAASAAELLPEPPVGPATGKVVGRSVTDAWSLDGGALAVEPPPANYTPALTHDQAACSLTAGVGIGHWRAGSGRLALATVSIRADVQERKILGNLTVIPDLIPDLPPVPTYRGRVAWILITDGSRPLSCGPELTASDLPVPTHTPFDHAEMRTTYAVYAIDAASGADAVVFTESHADCPQSPTSPATVTVPYQRMSVPWVLESRSADGRTAILSATWSDCERYGQGSRSPEEPDEFRATVDADTPDRVTIVVNRPFGPPCGAPVARTVRLAANQRLPETLIHAPTGLVVWRG